MLFYIVIFSFGLMLAIQFYYYAVYLNPLENYIDKKKSDVERKVSVLVCAHNEEDTIAHCITKILDQNYSDFELIVVNDRSDDSTQSIINLIEDSRLKTITIEQVKEGVSSKKNAISKGIEIAEGEFVMLTDADSYPKTSNWLKYMMAQITDEIDLVLGYSPYEIRKGWLNKLIQFDTFLTGIQYLSFALKKQATMGVGRNLLVRKSAFQQVKGYSGFEHVLAGDDDILVQKIATNNNVSICVDKQAHVMSQPENTWKKWYSQKRRHLSVGFVYTAGSKWLAGVFQQSLLALYILFLFSILTIGFGQITLIMLAMLFFRAVILYAKLRGKLNFNLYFYVLPILEMYYLFHFILIGMLVLFTKKRTWE